MKKITFLVTAACAFLLGMLFAPQVAGQGPNGGARFDHVVRNDIFAGFSGDREALERAMKEREETLASHPDHAEPLVFGKMVLKLKDPKKTEITVARDCLRELKERLGL